MTRAPGHRHRRARLRHVEALLFAALCAGASVSITSGGAAQTPANKPAPAKASVLTKPDPKSVKTATVAPLTPPPLPVPNPQRLAREAEAQAAQVQQAATAQPQTGADAAPAQQASGTQSQVNPGLPQVAVSVASPEAQYMAKLDQLIAPVRDFIPAPQDVQKLKDAVRLQGIDAAAARDARAEIAEPALKRLAEWLSLRAGVGEPTEFMAFLAKYPAWADRQTLIRRAEEQLFTQGGSAQKIKSFFKDGEPKTGAGFAALASAYLAEGDETKARELATNAWRNFEMAASLEHGFLERFRPLLSEADHRRRLDRILVDEVRFSAERTERAALAKRMIPLLPQAEHAKIDARIAIFLRAKQAAQMMAAVPVEPQGQPIDWGFQYQKLQLFRRNNQMDEAWKILKAAPTDAEAITSPDDWWIERRGAAYEALKAGDAQLAYDLVSNAGQLSANPLKDQSFMAGWIAMRFLKRPADAIKHFEASRAAADGPLSEARADYWLARAFEAVGRADDAKKSYAGAAKQADTFHGQLAQHKLASSGPVEFKTKLPAEPTADEVKLFNSLDSVKAAVAVTKLGLDRSVRVSLFGHLRNHLKTEGEVAMLAHLASALGDHQTSLRVGKTGIARGMNLTLYAYPLHAFPAYTPLRDPPEPAVLLGIARQETEFNNAIVSSAGARGLLQVMPITAQHICRDHRIKCEIGRLITDNSYNAMIASAYIGDRMAEFRGNYVLTLAGYNAGPGRARQWMREFGDPREPNVDPIDWIERIPIEETRDYVKKVLANVQVYRARLGEEQALRLEQDLVRTSGARRAETPGAAPLPAQGTGKKRADAR